MSLICFAALFSAAVATSHIKYTVLFLRDHRITISHNIELFVNIALFIYSFSSDQISPTHLYCKIEFGPKIIKLQSIKASGLFMLFYIF